MKLEFPKNFLWGAATSAHQVEGGNHNDWSEWEKETGHEQSGRACDHYNRFREDFDITKSLNHNAHRFSIEWSRIEPEEGRFDEKEIAHYQEVINALRERGIEPFVTLWHRTLPVWMRDKGGVESKEFPKYFARFSEYAVKNLKGVNFWVTLNEPTSVIFNSYLRGLWPPQKKSAIAALKVYWRLAEAHNAAYRTIHKIQKGAKVGFGNIMSHMEPVGASLLNKLTFEFANFFSNKYFLKLTKNNHDFLAAQYYFHFKVKFPAQKISSEQWRSDMDWGIYPEGLYHILKSLQKYNKPIYITENGVADAKDIHREKFIKEHLKYVHKAISEGVDVRGYFYWSLLDNFEWDKGFWPRFGLVEMNYETMERKIRPSALEYAKIAKENAVETGS